MDKYKARQISVLLIVVVIFIVTVRCCSHDNSNDKDLSKTAALPAPTVTLPEIDLSEFLEQADPDPMAKKYSELSEIKFEEIDFKADDLSLISKDYIEDLVVVGDSISMGYSVYKRLDENNTLAVGSIGHRNIMDTNFTYHGVEMKLLNILEKMQPKYIFLSLGMNDINVLTEEEYISKVKENISSIFEVTPKSKIIITAITPITYGNPFSSNDKIDTYNEALRKMVFDLNNEAVFFANAAQYLKDPETNSLKQEFSSGDGIHLSGIAYDYLLTYMYTMTEWM